MQIFELHFNPKKENHTFNTFLTEPQTETEKKKGSLYMAGEVTAPLLKPDEFLGKTANTIKKSFYAKKLNPEASLASSLKTANEFLGEEVKKENVGWLGNFNFAALSIKNYDLVFTKTGDIKIILIRDGQISDISKNLSLEEVNPYPVKVFFNVASGKLSDNDIVLILSNSVFEFIKEKGILENLAKAKDINAKKIRETLPQSLFTKGDGSKVSGLSLIFLFSKAKDKSPLSVLLSKAETVKKRSAFPVPIIVKPIKRALLKVKKAIPTKNIRLPKITRPFVSLKQPAVEKGKKDPAKRNKIILLVTFFCVLAIGFLIFKTAEDKREAEILASFKEIEKKVKQAESLMLSQNQKEADRLFKESFKELLPLTERDSDTTPSIISLKETIRGNLERLNKLERIADPEILFIAEDFSPEKIAYSSGNIYLYNSSSSIQKVDIETKEKETIELGDDIKKIDSSSSATLVSAGLSKIYYLTNGEWQENELGKPSSYQTDFDLFSSYLFNLYFIDKETCDITKYPYFANFEWGLPKLWHEDFGKTCLDPVSAAIDGSIWLLNQDNTVTRYYTGEFQENIKFDIFPFPEEFTQIDVKNNLYILEPKNNRIIIIDKDNEIVKQFQSEQFSNLKSFALSATGKTIYLLNGNTIYRIEI